MGIKLAERAHIIEVVRVSFIYTISVLIVLLQAKCCRSGMPKKRGNNQRQSRSKKVGCTASLTVGREFFHFQKHSPACTVIYPSKLDWKNSRECVEAVCNTLVVFAKLPTSSTRLQLRMVLGH